jgi:hypothetical protein
LRRYILLNNLQGHPDRTESLFPFKRGSKLRCALKFVNEKTGSNLVSRKNVLKKRGMVVDGVRAVG